MILWGREVYELSLAHARNIGGGAAPPSCGSSALSLLPNEWPSVAYFTTSCSRMRVVDHVPDNVRGKI